MNFNQLIYLVEADDFKAGQRYFNAQQAEGPAGVAASPVGKANFNPELPTGGRPQPADKGFRDDKYVNSILRNTIRLIKTRKSFYPGIRDIFEQFSNTRASVPLEVEKALKTMPNLIDRTYSKLFEKERLLQIKRENPEHSTDITEEILLNGDGEFRIVTDETKKDKNGNPRRFKVPTNPGINYLKEKLADYKDRYATAQAKIERVVEENEKAEALFNNRVSDYINSNIVAMIQELEEEYQDEIKSVQDTQTITSFDQIDSALAEKATGDQSINDVINKIAVLKKLSSDIEAGRGIIDVYLELSQNTYEEAKEYIFDKTGNAGANASEVVNKLFERLPLNRLKDFFNRIKDEAPIKLPSKDYIRKTKGATTMGDFLKQIAPGDLADKSAEIIAMLDQLKVDEFRKKAVVSILSNPKDQPQLKLKKLIGMIGGIKREAGYSGAISFGESFKQFHKTLNTIKRVHRLS